MYSPFIPIVYIVGMRFAKKYGDVCEEHTISAISRCFMTYDGSIIKKL